MDEEHEDMTCITETVDTSGAHWSENVEAEAVKGGKEMNTAAMLLGKYIVKFKID